MSGPLGGVGDLYAAVGAGAYLIAQPFKGVGGNRAQRSDWYADKVIPVINSVYEYVSIDDELEREVFKIIEDPSRVDDVWNLLVKIRDDIKLWDESSHAKKYGHLYFWRLGKGGSESHPVFRRKMSDDRYVADHLRNDNIKELKDFFPLHVEDFSMTKREVRKMGLDYISLDAKALADRVVHENRLAVADYIMSVWHRRDPKELRSSRICVDPSSITYCTHHGRKEYEIRKLSNEKLRLPDQERSLWVDSCWERISAFVEENSLFYRLIHDHPVYSYRGDALYLVRNGNDGFTAYDEYPSCWDYVGVARPSLDNPVNLEHFILMLMAAYKIVPKSVRWEEIFDRNGEYSKNGTVRNWIRGEDWQNELKTPEEKRLESEEFLERSSTILSSCFDL